MDCCSGYGNCCGFCLELMFDEIGLCLCGVWVFVCGFDEKELLMECVWMS